MPVLKSNGQLSTKRMTKQKYRRQSSRARLNVARHTASRHMPIEKITVWGKPFEIDVYEQSKAAWIAVGEYMGERIKVTSATRNSAAKSWAEVARDKSMAVPTRWHKQMTRRRADEVNNHS
jgi:hypothetical protein